MTALVPLARFARSNWRWILIGASAPPLMFPTRMPAATVVALAINGLAWIAEAARRPRRIFPPTPLQPPLILLGIMVVVSYLVSPAPDLSLPKFTGVVLGMLLLRVVLLDARAPNGLWKAVALYLLAGALLVTLGVLTTAFFTLKVPALSTVTSFIPRRFSGIPGAENGANPNALGGTTLFFVPLLGVLCAAGWRRNRLSTRLVLGAELVAFLAVLAISQSRTAWVSVSVTFALLTAVRHRPVRWILAVALLGAIAATAVIPWPPASKGHVSAGSLNAAAISLAAREELWSRAIDGIQDFTFTGMGLGAFRRVVHELYPLPLQPPEAEIAHAHNVFLQTALDVGLPGLIAYLGLLLTATGMCWRVYQRGSPMEGWLAFGLWGNLIAIHVFGLSDAIALGAKVGLFFWWDLALIGALHARVFAHTVPAVQCRGLVLPDAVS